MGRIVHALHLHVTLRVLLSVVIALLLWLTLYTSINPPSDKELSVELYVRNRSSLEDKGIILMSEEFSRSVRLSLKGRQEDLDPLSANNFEATLDLSKINSVEDTRLSIDLVPTNVERVAVAQMTPSEILLDLDEYASKYIDINVHFEGEDKLPEGYLLTNRSWSQRQLLVKGSKSLVDQASHALAVVDIEGQAGNGNAHPECKIISVEGEEMNVNAWIQTIEVTFEISKEVQVRADVSGVPDSNSYILSIDVDPQSVYVHGYEDALAEIDSLYTERIDVTDERASVSMRKYIIVPGGLRISTRSPSQAVVDVVIDQYRFDMIFISKSNISLVNSEQSGDYRYEIAQSEISVIVRGKRNDMNDLDKSSVSAVVNVEGLRPGTSSRPLIVTLPDGIRIAGDPFVDVIVSDVNAQVPAEPNGAEGDGGEGGTDGAEGEDGAEGAEGAGGDEEAVGAEGDGGEGDAEGEGGEDGA